MAAVSRLTAALVARTRSRMRAWPPAMRTAGHEYFASPGNRADTTPRTSGRSRRRIVDQHYWLHLLNWLMTRASPPDPALLDDVVWAQYCLFVFIRMQDDVFDGQVRSPRLLFVANEFLLEAERAFARCSRPEVAEYVRGTIAETSRAILAVDVLQRRDIASVSEMTALYAAVAAIFKAAPAAICLAHDDFRALGHAEAFADGLAVAGQLIDDFEDIDADLEDGRLNLAVRILAPRVCPRQPGARRAAHRAIVEGTRLPKLFALIREHVSASRAALAPLDLPDAEAYLQQVDRDVDALERAVHRARVRAVFDPPVGTARVRPAS
jgi:hypothetical protein